LKNMIITAGILLVMTVGMVYNADCRSLTACQRRLEWACEEAVYAAALAQAEGGEEGAIEAAGEVLCRNLQADGNGMISEGEGPFEGPLRWQLTLSENLICLDADCGFFRAQLPFLQKTARIHTQKILYMNME